MKPHEVPFDFPIPILQWIGFKEIYRKLWIFHEIWGCPGCPVTFPTNPWSMEYTMDIYIYIFHENEVSRPSSMFLCTATNRLEIMSQARGRIVAAPQVHRRTCGFLGETWRFHQEFNGRVGVVWEYHGYIIQLYITNHQYIYI